MEYFLKDEPTMPQTSNVIGVKKGTLPQVYAFKSLRASEAFMRQQTGNHWSR